MSRFTTTRLGLSGCLLMERIGLAGLPTLAPAPGYAIRRYEPTDDADWDRVVGYCFGSPHEFESTLRTDPAFRPERVLMLTHQGRVVGTGCAWHRGQDGADTGYLQMICVMPRHRKKSLGFALSLACLLQLQSERRTRALLHTDEGRWAAIRTYLRLGFQPVCKNAEHEARWRDVMVRLADVP